MQVGGGDLGDGQGREEADHAGLTHLCEGDVLDRYRGEFVAGRADNVVECAIAVAVAVAADAFEERLDVLLGVLLRREVAACSDSRLCADGYAWRRRAMEDCTRDT